MEQWPSGYDTGLPNQTSHAQMQKLVEKLPEYFIHPSKVDLYQGFLGIWWLKVGLYCTVTLQSTENGTLSTKWSTKTNEP